jgi:hypothetical protein
VRRLEFCRNIKAAMLYPTFNIKTVASVCDSNNGSAEVKVTGSVEVVEIRWDIQGVVEIGQRLLTFL